MEVIKRWLAGSKNFVVGRTYYRQFGKDKKLVALFDKGETPFARQQLIAALQQLVKEEKGITAPKAPAPAKKAPDTPKQTPGIMPKGDDTVTMAIEKEWRPLYQRMNFLRHELDKYGTDNSAAVRETCRLLCEEILELEQKCMQCWEKLDYYNQHGRLPELQEKKLEIPKDPAEIGKLIESIKKNIRRNKQKAKDKPDNPLYAALVKEWEEKLLIIQPNKNAH